MDRDPVELAELSALRADKIHLMEIEIPHLRRHARFLCKDDDLADDLVQECLVRAIEHADQWESGSNMRAWLITILRNCYMNRRRREAIHRRALEQEKYFGHTSISGSQEDSFALSQMERCFPLLSQNYQEILRLTVVEGLTYESVAQVLDVEIGTVKSRLNRARNELRRLMDRDMRPDGHVRKKRFRVDPALPVLAAGSSLEPDPKSAPAA